MRPFDDTELTDFVFDDRYDIDEDNDGSLFEDGYAYALEDLIDIVKQQQDDSDDISPEYMLTATPFFNDEDALIWGLTILCQSPMGRNFAFDARFEDWSLEVDDIEDGHPIINPQLRILILPRGTPSAETLSRSTYDRLQFLNNLARGLRMMWQDMHEVRARHDLTVDDQIFFERMRRADMDVMGLRILWDLKNQGYAAIWRHMLASDVSDVAIVANHFWNDQTYPAGLTETFLTWMGSDHLLSPCDGRTLGDMDARLQKSVQDVCGLSVLNADDILNIAHLPEGTSYLAPLARTLCYSREFRQIPELIHEAHLRQIVEECSELMIPSLTFHDSDLERKLFPDKIIDTLA